LPQKEKIIVFVSRSCIAPIAMHVHAEKCHSSVKKITQFKFPSFQENILYEDDHYLLKKRVNLIIAFLSNKIDMYSICPHYKF